ncbi:MAG: hypothetical protein HY064_08600, partial [Bacteroidetes bacterium]|nr:hypothetical protein [Bacteroidota bacterium]
MARKIKMAIGATVFALCFSNLVLGQLIWPANNLATPAFSRFGEIAVSGFAANQTRSIGIGNFTANAALTHAFLDINSNYLLLPTNVSIASFGEVFRTTSNAPAGTFNAWRMYTGAGIGTEIFNISNSGATNIVSLGTTQNGNLNFFTNNMQRITIVGLAGPTQGFVSIGNTFTTPLFRLDVQDNINVNPNFLNDGYRISGITVLQIPGFRNTFVGRGTG